MSQAARMPSPPASRPSTGSSYLLQLNLEKAPRLRRRLRQGGKPWRTGLVSLAVGSSL